jgi:hypothetical protein
MDQDRSSWQSMADISQLGVETAASVVQKLLATTRDVTSLRVPLLPATTNPTEARQLRADAERLIDLYSDWTRSLLDGFVQATTRRGTDDGGLLVLGPVGAGESATGTAWLHVLDEPGAEGTLLGTDLVAHHGCRIDHRTITFNPRTLNASAARTSHEVKIQVEVPPVVKSGPYYGHVLVEGFPELCLNLRVDVE